MKRNDNVMPSVQEGQNNETAVPEIKVGESIDGNFAVSPEVKVEDGLDGGFNVKSADPQINIGDSVDEGFTVVKEREPDPNGPYTYLKKSVRGFYVEFPWMLDESEFDNLGSDYQDFLDNKWVLLSKEQVEFKVENADASIEEIIKMELKPVTVMEVTIDDAKRRKLSALRVYDNSSNVNEFTINGELKAWFTADERAKYKSSIEAAKLLGEKEVQLFVGDTLITVDTEKADVLLATIQRYADKCYIVTKQHEVEINGLDSIEAVEEYDFETGYPDKLEIEV